MKESCLALLSDYAELYNERALRKKQLQLPTQSTLKKIFETLNIIFQFHYGKKLVSKSNLQDLTATGV